MQPPYVMSVTKPEGILGRELDERRRAKLSGAVLLATVLMVVLSTLSAIRLIAITVGG